MHSINNAAVLNRVLYLFIYKSWIGDSTEDEATDQDNDLGKEFNHELVSNVHAIGQVATVSSIDNIFYLQMLLLIFTYLPALRKRKGVKRKQQAKVQCDSASVIQFVHSWDDVTSKRQFWLTHEDFYQLEKAILDNKFRQGYDLERHYKYASRSSGSPIKLELRLFITLRLLGGASYLDIIWYGVSLHSIPALLFVILMGQGQYQLSYGHIVNNASS